MNRIKKTELIDKLRKQEEAKARRLMKRRRNKGKKEVKA
jgi:hypothetical protein